MGDGESKRVAQMNLKVTRENWLKKSSYCSFLIFQSPRYATKEEKVTLNNVKKTHFYYTLADRWLDCRS